MYKVGDKVILRCIDSDVMNSYRESNMDHLVDSVVTITSVVEAIWKGSIYEIAEDDGAFYYHDHEFEPARRKVTPKLVCNV